MNVEAVLKGDALLVGDLAAGKVECWQPLLEYLILNKPHVAPSSFIETCLSRDADFVNWHRTAFTAAGHCRSDVFTTVTVAMRWWR